MDKKTRTKWIKKAVAEFAKFLRKHMKRITAVLFGFLGGMAPLLITVAHQLFNQAPDLAQKNIGQMITGMLLFAAAGAIVVAAVGELELLKAFIQGIGAPAMISMYLQQAEAQANKGPASRNQSSPADRTEIVPAAPSVNRRSESGWNLLPQAYAQEPATQSTLIPNRILEVRPKGDIDDVTVEFFDANSNSIANKVVDAFARIAVPPRASTVVFSKEAAVASPVTLPAEPGATVYYEVIGTQGRKEYNLLSSITGKGDILYKLQVLNFDINVLKPGDEGWAFVGRRAKSDWTATYLDFDQTHPQPNRQYTVQYYITVLDKPADKALRLGRLVKGQKVLVKEFRGYNSPSSQSNQFAKDGDYYARVTVLPDE